MRALWILVTVLAGLLSCQNRESNRKANQDTNQQKQASIFVENLDTQLDLIVPKCQAEYPVPCVGIGLIENGQIKSIKVFGSHQSNKPAPKNTIFNVASVTKLVTAMTTLRLINNNQWQLDEPLAKYWVDPDVVADLLHKKLNTRHVLIHTTGFNNWRRMYPDKKLKFEMIDGKGFPQLSIYPQNNNTFFPLDFDLRFVFEKDNQGRVISFEMKQGEKVNLKGTRE